MNIAGTECARARESVSADLDCELHELDLRRLKAHLGVCADCSAWAESIKSTTVRLRETPFAAPPAFELPHRRRVRRIGAALAVVPAAAALVAGVVVSLGGAQHGARTTRTALDHPHSHLAREVQPVDLYGLPQLFRVFQAV
jgi:predicted anti-sigma-YlaC factor YlaD